MSKMSVIMPLYNAEKYLEECLDSVMAQTFTDFELICVNDAATDATLEIAERFRAKDSRIKILNNDVRSGAAYARNKGMEDAQGEYLAFLDGDDIFDEGMLGAAYQTAIDCMADIVMYEYKHVPKAMKLMASKLAVAGIIEGNLSEEGLAAMSDVKDLTSQMAKELALGIKDNVEDIAATFKKMAVINPHRERVRSAAVPIVAAVDDTPAPVAMVEPPRMRTIDTENKQALYDGLLQRTLEERRKKKSKKKPVDENQLSFFDFVA